jgi:hypothetical protein
MHIGDAPFEPELTLVRQTYRPRRLRQKLMAAKMIGQVGSAKADLDVADPEFRDDRREISGSR